METGFAMNEKANKGRSAPGEGGGYKLEVQKIDLDGEPGPSRIEQKEGKGLDATFRPGRTNQLPKSVAE
jgi:hypothetical protein